MHFTDTLLEEILKEQGEKHNINLSQRARQSRFTKVYKFPKSSMDEKKDGGFVETWTHSKLQMRPEFQGRTALHIVLIILNRVLLLLDPEPKDMYRCLPYHFMEICKPPVNEPIGSYQIHHLNGQELARL